jgi:hypothetical protein
MGTITWDRGRTPTAISGTTFSEIIPGPARGRIPSELVYWLSGGAEPATVIL